MANVFLWQVLWHLWLLWHLEVQLVGLYNMDYNYRSFNR